MKIFNKVKNKQDNDKRQREAEVRAAKLEIFYMAVLKLAVENELTVGMAKTALNQLIVQLSAVFDSRPIAEFQDDGESEEVKEDEAKPE